MHGSDTVECTGSDKRFDVFPVQRAEVYAFKKVEDVGVGAVFFAFGDDGIGCGFAHSADGFQSKTNLALAVDGEVHIRFVD